MRRGGMIRGTSWLDLQRGVTCAHEQRVCDELPVKDKIPKLLVQLD